MVLERASAATKVNIEGRFVPPVSDVTKAPADIFSALEIEYISVTKPQACLKRRHVYEASRP